MTSTSRRRRHVTAAALAAATAAVACSCSSTDAASASGASSPVASSPGVSMSGTVATIHLYGVQESSNVYTPDGQPVAHPSTAPALGSYVVGTDTDYDGSHTTHSTRAVGSDHLYCLITNAPATGTCSAQFQLAGGMLISDHSTQELAGNGIMTFPVTGGTGSYAEVHGTVTVTPVADTGNSDFTINYSH